MDGRVRVHGKFPFVDAFGDWRSKRRTTLCAVTSVLCDVRAPSFVSVMSIDGRYICPSYIDGRHCAQSATTNDCADARN
jgi:hypothetical protein